MKGKMTMNTVLTGTAAALISAAAFTLLKDTSEEEKKHRRSILWLFLSLVVYGVTDISGAFMARRAGCGVPGTVSLLIAANFIFLLGYIDIRHRRIPNIYVAASLVLRTVLIAAQGMCEQRTGELFLRSLAGLAAGALLTGAAWLVSGKGIGAGDIKMFAAIGYFTGGFAVVDILVYSTVFCCICGILLVIFRKCRLKDSIPMAPFAYAGTMVYLLAGM